MEKLTGIDTWLAIAFIVIAVVTLAYEFYKLSKDKKKATVKQYAYEMVVIAERAFASQTGEKKFNYVYKALQVKFKWLRYIPSAKVHDIIEDCLYELKESLNESGGKNNEVQ